MAKVKKMAFGGMGGMGSKNALAANAANPYAARQNAMATKAVSRGPLKQAHQSGVSMKQDTAALDKIGQTARQNIMGKQFTGLPGSMMGNPSAARPGGFGAGIGSVGKPPAGGAMPAGSAEYAKAAQAAMNSTNSGTPYKAANNLGGTFMGAMKQLGVAPGMKSGGAVGSASKRADGIASRGKTKCKMY